MTLEFRTRSRFCNEIGLTTYSKDLLINGIEVASYTRDTAEEAEEELKKDVYLLFRCADQAHHQKGFRSVEVNARR